MNKKFSTLMAGLMLASAFSVADAQNLVQKYETSKTYWLGVGESNNLSTYNTKKVIAVVSDPNELNYGQLVLVNYEDLKDIHAVKAAAWSIAFTQPTDGTAPKFTYVNKATGLTLSLDADAAKKALDAGANESVLATIKGSASEFLNTDITDAGTNKKLGFAVLRSYYDANNAVYLAEMTGAGATTAVDFGGGQVNATQLVLGAQKNATVNTLLNEALVVAPIQPAVFPLNADDLNSQLGKLDLNVVSDDQKGFNLYFNKDVTEGAETNLFAASKLQAVQVGTDTDGDGVIEDNGEMTPYVKLYNKDLDNGTYITVDTAYHAASESIAKLPKFTYAKSDYEGTNNVARMKESSHFAFAYDPFTDQILIKSRAYYTRVANTNNTPFKITGADGNDAYTYWGKGDRKTKKEEAYVRLATLGSVRELTVADDKMTNGNTPDIIATAEGYDAQGQGNKTAIWTTSSKNSTAWAQKGMLTTVKMSQDDLTFSPATIADGLYLIKLHTSGYDKDGNKRKEANGDYLIASLAGNFGYAEQAKNQNYDHMPAAQWYVKQNGTSTTAPISIQNREFFDQYKNSENKTYFADEDASIQAFNAGDGKIFFTNGVFANDTLEFIPVSAASKADANLGYKYVDEKQASVETYYFNYLSGLAQDKGLNTPSDKDSLVRVDETGDKIALRLIPVVKDDSYGIQLDEKKTGIKNLVRNAYYIEAYDNLKFAADGRSRYLSYEPSSKKYVMSLVPEMFFLKENNDIDGTHYYALVKAEGYGKFFNDINNGQLTDTQQWNETLLKKTTTGYQGKVMLMYPAEYNGMSTVKDAVKVWSFYNLTQEKKVDLINNEPVTSYNWLSPNQRANVKVIFYDKNGEPIISDASEAVDLYAYMPNDNNIITLTRVTNGTTPTDYYAMNPDEDLNQCDIFKATSNQKSTTKGYALSRISVDDNTLDLFIADLGNINNDWSDELRVSAFEAQVNDSPLYRRFNGANGEYGTEANAPLNLKFFRHNNNAEYLFENYASENEYRDGINDKEISFLGVNNAFQFPESETRSYTMFVDTAYVRANTRMPQYLIGIRPEVVLGDTTLCDATTHQHKTPEEALACEHTKINVGFTRAMYLFNAQDSVDVKNYDYQGKAAYGAQGYTRLAFKDAVHANDTLYILNPNVTTEELKACNLKNDKLFAKKIALDNNKHKNVVFQFRLVTDEDNRFLIESEAEENGKAVFNKDLKNVSVAPMRGGWVKIQNGVPVIARFDDFNEAIAQAEIFDVNDEIKYDATANDEIAVEGVTVVAGNGQVTIMGAAGKNVTITNILGKVIASQVIASDNATIAVPAGIVAVAVEGEAAVKAIVK